MIAGRFLIRPRPYDHPDATHLVRALFDDQRQRYGYADPASYTPPQGLFLVGYLNTAPVTCGGYRTFDERTRTNEAVSGLGLGERILTTLEHHAAHGGAQRSALETGVRNTEALALYTGIGYQPTARYAADRDPTINRAFTKRLTCSIS